MPDERRKILLSLGRLPDGSSKSTQQKCNNVSRLIGQKLAHTSYDIVNPGNIDSQNAPAIDAFITEVGDKRIQTYLPRIPYERECGHEGSKYKPAGTTQILDDYPEQRRFRMVENSDIVLVLAGTHGTSENVMCAKKLSKPIIPIPHFGGIARNEYNQLINNLEADGDTDALRLFREIGNYSLSDDEITTAVIKAIDWLASKATYSHSIFLAMSFDKNYSDAPDIVDAIKTVVKDTLSWSVVLGRDLEIGSNQTLIELIREFIKKSPLVIVDLHDNRPNVYYEAGIAHGSDKPTIFITKNGDDVNFNLASHERIVWGNIQELKNKLSEWLPIAARRCKF
jgi:hypothetical protein